MTTGIIMATFAVIVAMGWRNADRMAIANGRALNIDKQLDAMLMG
ncbi:gp0.7 [Escherichia phage 13a]|uniref:Gp0.7 n=1 Tax=Escherichia phage 13a TaxID=532076 RepID=B3VD32_9CAUD|nr:gp0.7 [Escherichia phage 13a]ACF15887.1 gp0.7 [Escherichia phage 13a]